MTDDPDEPLGSVDEATPAWLTAALRRRGALDRGDVTGLTVARVHEAQLKTISYFLVADYSPDAGPAPPRHLLLKLPRQPTPATTGGFSFPGREHRLYRALIADGAGLPVVACFSTAHDAASGRYHLLLEDLTATHGQPVSDREVGGDYVRQTLACLARLHAYWWAHPPGPQVVPPDYGHLADPPMLERLTAALPALADALGPALASADRRLYERALDALPALSAARAPFERQTLVHGDAHFWNFLYPRDPADPVARAIDWHTCHVGPLAEDLAYLLVLRDPDRTAERERAHLRFYHDALASHGVELAWDELWAQYRNLAAEQLLVPLYWCMRGAPDWFWPIFVPRALGAFRELGCEELL